MMQAASDIFLGWTEHEASGRQYYVRMLKNRRLGAVSEIARGRGLGRLRQAVRTHAGARPRALGRSGRDRRLYGRQRGLRRGHRRFRPRLCQAQRGRPCRLGGDAASESVRRDGSRDPFKHAEIRDHAAQHRIEGGRRALDETGRAGLLVALEAFHNRPPQIGLRRASPFRQLLRQSSLRKRDVKNAQCEGVELMIFHRVLHRRADGPADAEIGGQRADPCQGGEKRWAIASRMISLA